MKAKAEIERLVRVERLGKPRSDKLELRNDKDELVAVGTFRKLGGVCRKSCPEGIYNMVGKDTDLVLERSEGIVYPTSGYVKGGWFQTRTLAQAKEFFGKP